MQVEVQSEVGGRMHRRMVVVDGSSVSRLVVRDEFIRLLGAEVRSGNIGGVETDREHRRQGYSRRLMEDTLRYMADMGQEVSMLFGIPDFYDKFGYAPFMAEYAVRVATRDAERLAQEAPGHTARSVQPEDRPFIVDLYSRDSRLSPGALVRSRGAWPGFRMGSDYGLPATAFVLQDTDGRLAAYAAFDDRPTQMRVIEAGAADPRLFPALLRELAARAIERRCEHIELLAPPDHPFARVLTRCGCRITSDYPRMGGGMMRLIDQDALLARLESALAERIGNSRFTGACVTLCIETDLATTDLQLGAARGRGERVEAGVVLPQQTLVQLVTGYRTAADVLAETGVESRGQARGVLEALFGGQTPYVWRTDRF